MQQQGRRKDLDANGYSGDSSSSFGIRKELIFMGARLRIQQAAIATAV
jgi:hypothetical protein